METLNVRKTVDKSRIQQILLLAVLALPSLPFSRSHSTSPTASEHFKQTQATFAAEEDSLFLPNRTAGYQLSPNILSSSFTPPLSSEDLRPPSSRRNLIGRGPRSRSRFAPCWARNELLGFYKERGKKSRPLSRRLLAYAKLHRSCTADVSNWTALVLGDEEPPKSEFVSTSDDVLWSAFGQVGFESKKGGERENGGGGRCRYLLYQYNTPGLGNRIQGLVSTFAYALLTGRVLLMGDWAMAELVCNPFPESRWFVSWNEYDFIQKLSRSTGIEDLMKAAEAEGGRVASKRNPVYTRARVDLSYEWSVKDQKFFCDRVQTQLARVMWLTVNTEQYFIPALFIIPSFKTTLEELFPDRAPFTHLARHLIHPVNYLWERITRIYAIHFKPSHERIGVQIRTFASNDSYAFDRIRTCLSNISGALPKAIVPEEWRETFRWGRGFMGSEGELVADVIEHPHPVRMTLFVTSLHSESAAFFRSIYTEGVAADGSLVDVYSYSSEGEQTEDLVHDERALVDMFLLSFCGKLFTTHFSTFGYVAAGLSGKAPYLLNIIAFGAKTLGIPYEENGRPVCERSHSAEPCQVYPPHVRYCQGGEGKVVVGLGRRVTGSRHTMHDAVYFRQCQDEAHGIRLVPESQP